MENGKGKIILTLVLLDDMPNPLDAVLQLTPNPLSKRIDILQHHRLLLQLPPHIIRLLP